jgi:hypothetical protein
MIVVMHDLEPNCELLPNSLMELVLKVAADYYFRTGM